ncbi:periplasmic heavy metal sensor [Hymenobacter daeguensis]
MKASFLTLLAAFALTIGTAAAQAPEGGMPGGGYGRMQGNPEEMAKRQTERMTQELGLNADQAAKVQQIQTARAQEMQAMRGQAGGDRDKMREQMQASRAKYDAQYKEVLTADQYTKYTSMQANRMNRGGGPGMGGPGPDANIDKMKAKTKDGDKIKAKEDKVKVKADGVKTKAEN